MKQWIIIAMCVAAVSVSAQEAQKKTVTPYFRNALTTMMVYHPEDEFGYDVYEIFNQLAPLEKYDSHPIKVCVIDNSKITGVKGKPNGGLHRQTYGGSMVLTAAEKEKNGRGMEKLLNDAEVGKRIVAKWFDLQGDSVRTAHFSTRLLEDRSDYNATISEVERARYTAEGMTALRNVSEDLLRHSFVLVSDMTYITAEQRADAAKKTLAVLGGVFDALTGGNSGQRLAETAGDIADKYTGFKVFTHSYLYQLVWNDSLSNVFYQNYYTEEPNEERILAFLKDETSFQVRYLGEASATYEKTQKKGKYDRTELLELITCRSIDNNVAELQHQFEDFRIKTPITAVEYNAKGKLVGFRAQVGQKEGVKESSTFEVLEAKVEKGRIIYNRVATIKPVNNHIWDNRFNALLENDEDVLVEGTLFKLVGGASKDITPGMIIREI